MNATPEGSPLLVARSGFRLPSPAPGVMAILNVTPDSFSDGGVHFDHAKAVHAALQMEEDGAALIDIGGESTRPGSEGVSAEVEMERVVPVIEQIRRRSGVPISIDTTKAAVADAALGAGANVINDVSALRADPAMAPLAARSGVPVILMHMRGSPRTMQQHIHYDDVVRDVGCELAEFREGAVAAGIDRGCILIDPGIGFAKTYEHNLEVLARLGELAAIAPLVVGASRKAFIGHLTGREAGPDRAAGSLAAVAAAHRAGAALVRVHDVRQTVDFLNVLQAIDAHRRRSS
ncbi:MAG TPA: dihydropteroate synthase [Thermoanaerobaculia bacterium]|nr:dihydropteroate synthase [Thermoanaerobaculia bacterium]